MILHPETTKQSTRPMLYRRTIFVTSFVGLVFLFLIMRKSIFFRFMFWKSLLRFLVAQNLKITESSIFIFSKPFVWHSSGENVRMKERRQKKNLSTISRCFALTHCSQIFRAILSNAISIPTHLIAFLHSDVFSRWVSDEKFLENEYATFSNF